MRTGVLTALEPLDFSYATLAADDQLQFDAAISSTDVESAVSFEQGAVAKEDDAAGCAGPIQFFAVFYSMLAVDDPVFGRVDEPAALPGVIARASIA